MANRFCRRRDRRQAKDALRKRVLGVVPPTLQGCVDDECAVMDLDFDWDSEDDDGMSAEYHYPSEIRFAVGDLVVCIPPEMDCRATFVTRDYGMGPYEVASVRETRAPSAGHSQVLTLKTGEGMLMSLVDPRQPATFSGYWFVPVH